MDNWLSSITNWFLSLVKGAFSALLDFFHDLIIWIFGGVLDALAAVISAIPAPSFLTNSGANVGSLLSGLPSYSLYVIDQLHFPESLAIIGAGVGFNLTRKIFTLGQW